MIRLNSNYFVRGLTQEDLGASYRRWFEDERVVRLNSHGVFPKTQSEIIRFAETLETRDNVVWAICHDAEGHVGNVALQNISWVDRSAELALILGVPDHWGHGLGRLASERIIHHGFFRANLHRIYCATADTNIAMKRLATSLGFAEEGVRRKHLFLEGSWVDVVEYGLLRDDGNGE